MKKFLLSWILLITLIFFDLPTRAVAEDAYTTYFLYRISIPDSVTYVSGSTNISAHDTSLSTWRFVPLTSIIYSSEQPESVIKYLYDSVYFSFVNVGVVAFNSGTGYNYAQYTNTQAVGYFGGVTYSGVFPSLNVNIPFYAADGKLLKEFDLYNYNINPQVCGLKFFIRPDVHTPFTIKYPATVTFQYYFVAITTNRINVPNAQLISISNDLSTIKTTLNSIYHTLTNGFSTLNNDLLNILSVLNDIASSGGSSGSGTAAIVGAVNGAVASIGQVISQQSADIVGAIGSQTGAINGTLQSQTDSLNSTLSLLDTSINKITETLEQDKQENLDAVDSKGNELIGMATQMRERAESSWDALSLPFDFTKQIFSVFEGGTSSVAYLDSYGDVMGYRYDAETGCAVPVMRRYRNGTPRVTGGTVITFPSFSLSVPGVGSLKLWDDYTYDLSELTNQIPALFNALHLIIGVLLIYWLVGFLIDLGEDIIG